MAESLVVRTKRDIIWTITDLGAAHTYTGAYEPGDVSITVPGWATLHFLDRGELSTSGTDGGQPSIRKGDDQPMTVSVSVHQRDVGSTSYTTFMDLCWRYVGGYVRSNWLSTMGSSSDETTWTFAMTVDGTAFGESDKTVTLPYCPFRGNYADGDPNTFSATATSFAVVPTLS